MKININRLRIDIQELGRIGVTPHGGNSRLTFTPEDNAGRDFLIERLKEADLQVSVDRVGNIIGRRSGEDKGAPSIATGSHIDTVINGGKLDGVLGVLAAVEVMRTLNENKVQTLHPIELISFTNEEGVRFPLFVGSKAIVGDLKVEDAYKIIGSDGVSFGDALNSWKNRLEPLVPTRKRPGEIKAFVELHIEQGPILEAEKKQIGVVEAIVGITQLTLTIKGRADHAGTTPMAMRKDALLAASKIIQKTNSIAKSVSDMAVATVGTLTVTPGAYNIVPEKVEVGFDIRDIKRENKDTMVKEIKKAINDACKGTNLKYSIAERGNIAPVELSPNVIDTIASITNSLGFKMKRLHSGAGHDTMLMKKITDVGMIFVPSHDGRSHCPDEHTSWEDIERGANVLLGTLEKLAS